MRYSPLFPAPLILSAAGTVLAYITFVHQAETQETEQLVRESSLKEIVRICALKPGLEDDTERLFDGIARSMDDADLRSIVDTVHNHLTLLRGKPAGWITQKS